MRTLPTLLIATTALAVGSGATAQTRKGSFIGVGTSWSWGEVKAAGASMSGDTFGTLPIRLGGKIGERMLLGGELSHWDASDEDRANYGNHYGLALYYYPAEAGIFLKGGLGLSRAHVGRADLGSASGTGLGVMLGAGYDIPIGTRTAITPIATFWFGGPDELSTDGGQVVTGFRHNVIDVAVGITFY